MALLLALAFSTTSNAQTAPRIDPTAPRLQEEIKPLEPAPGLVLPPVPLPPKEKAAIPPARVFIREIRVIGSTVFSPEEISQVTAPYTNRQLSAEDLEELRIALTLLYVHKGYVNSGAVLPDQSLADGLVTIQIVEGKLTSIEVLGNRWFRSSYLSNRLWLGAGPPFNVTSLQERLRLLMTMAREAGAELAEGAEITRVSETASGVRLEARDGRVFEAPIVVAADGVYSTVARRLGFNPGWPRDGVAIDMMEETPTSRLRAVDEATLWVSFAPGAGHGYGYIFPKRDYVNVGVGYVVSSFRTSVRDAPHALHEAFVSGLKARGLLEGEADRACFTPYQVPVGGPLRTTARGRVYVAGDAGGFVNGFSAEGIYFAMVTGDLAARAILDGPSPRLYERLWRGSRLFAVVLALAGAFLVLGGPEALGGSLSWVDVLALTCGISFAGNYLVFRARQSLPVPTKVAAMLTGCFVLAVALTAATGPPLPAPGTPVWGWAAAYCVGWVLVASAGTQWGLTHVAAARSAVIIILELLTAILSAMLIGGEAMSATQVAGAACIVIAAYLEARLG